MLCNPELGNSKLESLVKANRSQLDSRELNFPVQAGGMRGLAVGRSRSSIFSYLRDKIDILVFAIFILLILVKVRSEAASSLESLDVEFSAKSDGDALRQIVFILLFLFSFAVYVAKSGIRFPKTLSVLQIAAISWLVLSAFWSPEPALAFRRAVFMALVAITTALMIQISGTERSLKAIYLALAMCILLSYLSLPLPFGRHPANEIDPALVGNWKGVFYHKNIAGAVMGMAFIFFFHFALNRRKILDVILMVLSLVFLLGTHSKTPLGFIMPALSIGLVYRYLYRATNGPTFFRFVFGLLLIAAAATCVFLWDDILATLANPLSFTGRGAIWQTAWAFLRDNFLFGAGYNSFWGMRSAPYITSQFVILIGHSHNGYLEVFVTSGIIGLLLTTSASVFYVIYQLLYSPRRNHKLCGMLLSMWSFGIMVNFLESQFYNIDKEGWIMLMITIFLTQSQHNSVRIVR